MASAAGSKLFGVVQSQIQPCHQPEAYDRAAESTALAE
jgi:hypothetical protein